MRRFRRVSADYPAVPGFEGDHATGGRPGGRGGAADAPREHARPGGYAGPAVGRESGRAVPCPHHR
ncbi:MAG: hypothetical protein GEU87_17720 [Alphaproteobacteria bacterium]|nr:hypothetical protein [Alphaproteobacteria bacterium]